MAAITYLILKLMGQVLIIYLKMAWVIIRLLVRVAGHILVGLLRCFIKFLVRRAAGRRTPPVGRRNVPRPDASPKAPRAASVTRRVGAKRRNARI